MTPNYNLLTDKQKQELCNAIMQQYFAYEPLEIPPMTEKPMTINEYLKAEYEKHPERWVVEFWAKDREAWLQSPFQVTDRQWGSEYVFYRLRPAVPEGLPALPDAAYCYRPDKPGAAYGEGPVTNNFGLTGWMLGENSRWVYSTGWTGDEDTGYLVDRTDSNAEAILELNRPVFTGMDTASDCDYTVIWEKSLTEKLIKNLDIEETDRLIANTAALSGALAQAGGDPETILCKDDIRELLRSLATNNIELRAVYSGARDA